MKQLSDPALPGLPSALDADALVGLLGEALREAGEDFEPIGGRAVDVQYSPGVGCHVLFKLKLSAPGTGRTKSQLLDVQVLREGQAPPPVSEALLEAHARRQGTRATRRDSPLRTAAFNLDRAGLAVHCFPVDPALPWLAEVADPDAARLGLHRAWSGRKVRVRRVRIDPLSYTPTQRAALRYEVLGESKDTGIPELRRFVAKLHARRPPARLFAGALALWRRSQGRVHLAPPVGYVSALHLSLQELLDGERLADLTDRPTFVKPVRQAARSIAHVHSLRLPLHSTRTAEKETKVIDRWSSVLERIHSGQPGRVAALARRIAADVEAGMRITGTVHADFHLANVMADRERVTIIDWDQIAHGDPMVDVGRFLGSLRVSALRTHGDPGALRDVGEEFLATYLQASGDDERRARLFEALALLIAAAGPFRLQREGWEEQAALMLEEVEAAHEASRAGPVVAAGGAPDTGELPLADRGAWAHDAAFVQALLAPKLVELHGPSFELTECSPAVERESATRLEMRYSLKGFLGSDRWRGAVRGLLSEGRRSGVLRRLHRAREALEADGAALRLPCPVGYLAPLGMLVVEPAPGTGLLDLIAVGDEAAAADAGRRIGEALAALQAAPAELGKQHSHERTLAAVERRLARLAETDSDALALARSVTDRAAARLEARSPCTGVELTDLDLAHLVVAPRGSGVRAVTDLVEADRLRGPAWLLAQLAAQAEEGLPLADVAARELRRAYLSATGEPPADLSAFEALALVRLACRWLRRDPPEPELPGALLARAEGLLQG